MSRYGIFFSSHDNFAAGTARSVGPKTSRRNAKHSTRNLSYPKYANWMAKTSPACLKSFIPNQRLQSLRVQPKNHTKMEEFLTRNTQRGLCPQPKLIGRRTPK